MDTYNGKTPYFSAKTLVFTALMTALVFLSTFLPHIPIPLGYAHLGDAVIFLLAILAERRTALLAACLGSALADFMGGFALWIVPTLIIKYIMAYIVCRMVRSARGNIERKRILIALVFASLWMAFGYTIAGMTVFLLHLLQRRGCSLRGASTAFLHCCCFLCCKDISRRYKNQKIASV